MRLRRLTPVHLASSGAGWAAPWEQLPEMKTTNLQTSKLLHIEDLKGWNKWNTKIPVNTFNQKGHAAADPCMDKFSVPVWMKPAAFGMLILWKCRRIFCTCRVFGICFCRWAVFHTPWEKRQFCFSRVNSCKIKLFLGTTCLAAFLREIPLSGTRSKARSDTRRMCMLALLFRNSLVGTPMRVPNKLRTFTS